MSSVDVGIGQDDYLVISEFRYVELVADTAAEGCDHILDLIGIEDPLESCLFNVEDLAPERKHRLAEPVSSLFGRTARGVTLYEEYL